MCGYECDTVTRPKNKRAHTPSFYIAQVQDEFYGNVGTPRALCGLSRVITKIESCRYESSTRKIGGSNPPLGTTQTRHDKSKII